MRSIAAWPRCIAGFIAEARERLAADPARREQPPNLLEAMIVAAEEGRTGIGDEQVSANVLTMLLAGEDTTANTLAWLIHLLWQHPAELQRAVDEVRRVCPAGRAASLDELAQLEHLEACTHEARAELGRKANALGFTTGQCVRAAIQRKIFDSHV